jgi:hypothetical protein
MTLNPQLLPPAPEATAAAVQAAFPKGNLSLLICIRPPGVLWKSHLGAWRS